MKVSLMNNPTLEFVDSGVGACWGKGPYGINEKGLERIDRVCNKFQHSSMLRFVSYIYDVELSTSALLELSRHTVAVNLAVKSTRYCTKQDPEAITVEYSKNPVVNALMDKHIEEIKKLIKENSSFSNDDLKLLLPQGFIYKMQVQFNAQSLQHFLKLRTDKTSHYHIRDLAYGLYDKLPEDHKFLFEEFLYIPEPKKSGSLTSSKAKELTDTQREFYEEVKRDKESGVKGKYSILAEAELNELFDITEE